MNWKLDQDSELPAYLQIRNWLRGRILEGELVSGSRLPAERSLAQALGVSRSTVVNAYDELEAEGLVDGHVGRGTIVLGPLAAAEAHPVAWGAHFSRLERRLSRHARPASLLNLHRLSAQPGVISFVFGLPDPKLLPPGRLLEAWEAVVGRLGSAAVGTGPDQGTLAVREVIAARSRDRGVPVSPEGVAVVNGSQHGLDLLLRLLTEPGDTVLVETPTYVGALQSFLAWGVRIIGVPVDEQGMDVDRAEFLLARYHPRFIYTVPTFQNPSGSTMTLERRERLLELSQQHQVPIIEDDPFWELYFDEPPPPPIKALDRYGHVLYLSTFSKTLAPGLRVGWLVAPAPVVDRVAMLNGVTELLPNTVGQHLVEEFARRGWLDEQLIAARTTYASRCRAMDGALTSHRIPGANWTLPGGGVFLWLQMPEGVDAQELLDETGQQGVVFLPGHHMYASDGPRNTCRLCFSVPGEEEIEKGVAVIASALKRLLLRPTEPSRERVASGPVV
jgi:DNA-binding transcriptional MocR family regulator